LIEVHNKSTYQRIYNGFSAVFVDSYCKFRRNGLNSSESLSAAKILIQDHLAQELQNNRLNPKTVMKAYRNVSNDSELIEKAILYYQRMK
jgi:hypothetical protein